MSTNLSDKLNIPINWTKVLIGSGLTALFMFILGVALKIRVLIAVADLFIFGTLFAAIVVFVISVIRKFSSKNNSQ